MLRDYLNEHPLVTMLFALAAPVLILCVIWHGAGESNATTRSLMQAWYTDDDGKTWYTDDKSLSPPFDHNGFLYVYPYRLRWTELEFLHFLLYRLFKFRVVHRSIRFC